MIPFQGTFVRSFSGVFIMMIFVHFDSSVRVFWGISGCKSGRKRSIHHEVVRHNNIEDDVSGNPKPKKAAAASVLGIVSPYTVPTLCHPQEMINHHDPSRWVALAGVNSARVQEFLEQLHHGESRWLATPKFGGLVFGANTWELCHLLSRWYRKITR